MSARQGNPMTKHEITVIATLIREIQAQRGLLEAIIAREAERDRTPPRTDCPPGYGWECRG